MIEKYHMKYGAVFALVLFIVGLITGMGGSVLVNVLSSIFLGACAALSLAAGKRFGKRKE